MKSYIAKKEDVQRKWHLIDADGAVLGRMATKVAMILMGKDKPTYTPHVDTGDYVVIINAAKIKISGSKSTQKSYQHYTGYPGGQRITTFEEMMEKKPEKVVELAIKRMLPKSKLGTNMLKKLKVYGGPEHEHTAQKPEKMEL
ncbi:MAG: 50S ribosomal protein L13 [Sedimentisphaerales bacterium]|nr:50S ribosomal protein L13 [Sedimentisphaerales bacterium]